MLPGDRRVVRVGVVAVVVAMGVLVVHRDMRVTVAVALAGVQVDSDRDAPAGAERAQAGRTIPQRPRRNGTDERGTREDRSGARGA